MWAGSDWLRIRVRVCKKCYTYKDELVQKGIPELVVAVDVVLLDVAPADNDSKTFLVLLPQGPAAKKKIVVYLKN